MRKLLLSLVLLHLSTAAVAVDVMGVRIWPAPDNTRVVLDIAAPIEHSVFALHNPERLVIDLKGSQLSAAIAQPGKNAPIISRIRSAIRNKTDLRMVLDLKKKVQPKSFLLKPNKTYGHRLVIDLHDAGKRAKRAPKVATKTAKAKRGLRDIVVAIDAGHGGEDPGAIGYRGTREKKVVLAVARKLYNKVKRQPGLKPVMIRDGDYYIGLKDRRAKARAHKADLFVSVHADAFKDKRARGSSVYVLSPNKASTSETASWLAESENASDLIGGVSLDDKDDILRSVLIDLSQTATIISSLDAAGEVLKQLKGIGRVHKRKVEQAGFTVLKSPDMPSMLVETAFISNPQEERNLNSSKYQGKMANAILSGVRSYFSNNPLPGTRLAAQRYTIRSGDTLSGVATQFRVSLTSLRKVNKLKGDRLLVGETLRIPL